MSEVLKQTRHPRYARHRCPAEVISQAVWLYLRFPLSLRIFEEMLATRGIEVHHERVRRCALKFGHFAHQIRLCLLAAGYKWHLIEVVISIAGKKYRLWRPVDQHGIVPDILARRRRNTTSRTAPAAQTAQEAGHRTARDDPR